MWLVKATQFRVCTVVIVPVCSLFICWTVVQRRSYLQSVTLISSKKKFISGGRDIDTDMKYHMLIKH